MNDDDMLKVGQVIGGLLAREEHTVSLHRHLAAVHVLAERERELLALKGPCSTRTCRLHRAHYGPCDTTTEEN